MSQDEVTLDQVLKAVADGISRVTGEVMACRAMINALIATHPNRGELAKALETTHLAAISDWRNVPPDELTRFRAEQLMEGFAQEIDDHGDAR